MENQKQQETRYKKRIQRFLGYLSTIDPNWIQKRSWFEDLKNMELGEDFFYKVIFAEEEAQKDKGDFFIGIFTYASINLQEELGKKNDLVKAGLEIELGIIDDHEESEHQELLDYLWWNTIYQMALKKKQFNESEKNVLTDLKRKFNKRIKYVEALLY